MRCECLEDAAWTRRPRHGDFAAHHVLRRPPHFSSLTDTTASAAKCWLNADDEYLSRLFRADAIAAMMVFPRFRGIRFRQLLGGEVFSHITAEHNKCPGHADALSLYRHTATRSPRRG